MKQISKLRQRAIWWRLWQWLRYHPMISVKVVKVETSKLKETLSSYGTMGYWCVHVIPYSERDEKGGFKDMVEVFMQREVHVGIHKLNVKMTDKEKTELINL